MKNHPLTTILLGMVAFSAVLSAYFCIRYAVDDREFTTLRFKVGAYNYRLGAVNMLANEVMEYSKKNPAIEPLLEATKIRAKMTPTPTNNAPAPAKSPSK